MNKDKAVTWTKDQQKVIDTAHANILVSAAAGSGKTAVLVARLMKKILSSEDPADIDSFLIVTFTKAAAAQLKEKIGRELSRALEEDPDNDHLRRQPMLLSRARITTIDGFCSFVVRNYAERIDVDPLFRIGESGELKLLEKDVVSAVLEEAYASKNEEFRRRFYALADTFVPESDTAALDDIILRVYHMAMSMPYPEEWFEMAREKESCRSFADLESMPWMKNFTQEAVFYIRKGHELTARNASYIGKEVLSASYEKMAGIYEALFEALENAEGRYEETFALLEDFKAHKPRLGRLSKNADPLLHAQVKAAKEEADEILKILSENYFVFSPSLALEAHHQTAEVLNTLLQLTQRFRQSFDEAKRRKNMADFADVAHAALTILRDENKKRTPAARELAESFREVMIDEYQDSNYLQEEILTAVSRIEDGEDNYFCVGDVKQSIYRFRNARPELFMRKYDDFADGNGGVRIDLSRNFRSRPEILEFVNDIFRLVMRREVGGIDYDKAAELVSGSDDLKKMPVLIDSEGTEDAAVEVLTVTGDLDEEDAEIYEEDFSDAVELEARAIGTRILSFVKEEKIRDASGGERAVSFRDMAILLRNKNAEAYIRNLDSMGIPSVNTSKEGFFDVMEITIILDYLMVLDNPRQDIPFAAVMHSPLGSFSADELALIRGCDAGKEDNDTEDGETLKSYVPSSLCDYASFYAQNGTDPALRQKTAHFLESLEAFRQEASHAPIHELLTHILKETGYEDYISALPDGRKRLMNIHALVEKAIDFEKTSYVGLFNFVRYINNLQKYEVDMDAASAGDAENAVRIVTIHKSKGLEYPIVFLAGMGKKFNLQDASSDLIVHPDLGLASIWLDIQKRRKLPTLKHVVFKQRLRRENIGEELRVLYVALTRAMLKLVITGTIHKNKKDESFYQSYEIETEESSGALSPVYLEKASTNWQVLLPCILKAARKNPERVQLSLIRPDVLVRDNIEAMGEAERNLEELFNWQEEDGCLPEVRQILEERYSFRYAYEQQCDMPAKVSVSDIKHAQMADEEAKKAFEETEPVPLVPQFMQDKKENRPGGAAMGTACHNLMARLDLSDNRLKTDEGLKAAIQAAAQNGFVDEEAARFLYRRPIIGFLRSDMGRRMAEADKKGRLWRERPFTMRIAASRVRKDFSDEEEILIQGVIDVYFEENGDIILLDYKTDRVAEAETLVDRYRVQLELYAEALQRATGKRVREIHIYSFSLEKDILMENA